MKIVDYSTVHDNYARRSSLKIALEVLTASLVFVLPAIILFIASL